MAKKTVSVGSHDRSKPSSARKNPGSPKPGPKTVHVDQHKRTPPSK